QRRFPDSGHRLPSGVCQPRSNWQRGPGTARSLLATRLAEWPDARYRPLGTRRPGEELRVGDDDQGSWWASGAPQMENRRGRLRYSITRSACTRSDWGIVKAEGFGGLEVDHEPNSRRCWKNAANRFD